MSAKKLAVLDYYALQGVPADLWFLSECLEDKDTPVREKAADVIIHIFRKLKSHEELSWGLKSVQLTTSGLDRIKKNFPPGTYVQLLAIASFNHSGYVREHAITLLAQSAHPEAIRYLLLRAGDWVKEVRQSALAGIRHYLQPAWHTQWLRELPLVDWLLKVKRVDLRELHHAVIDFLVTEPLTREVLQLLSDNERARKLLIRYQLQWHGLLPLLKEEIYRDKNFLVRIELIQYLPALPAGEQRSMLQRLLKDKSARVRLAALYATKPHLDALWDDIQELMYDVTASVRDLARRYAVNRGLPVVLLHRARLQTGTANAGVLMGLAEVGSKEDVLLFEKHIASPVDTIQSACLAGINRQDEQLATGYAISMLASSSRRVRSRCLAILSKGCDEGTLEKVRVLYAEGNDIQRKTFILLLGALGGWKIVGDLVTALCDTCEANRGLAWQYMQVWYHQSFKIFTTPANGDLARAKAAVLKIEAAQLPMSPGQLELWEQLRGYLMSYI